MKNYLMALIGLIFAYLTWGLPGHIFGEVDNWIVVACSIYGLFSAATKEDNSIIRVIRGGLYGAIWGNTLSDCLAAILDTNMGLDFVPGIASGCIVPVFFVGLISAAIEKKLETIKNK